MMKIKQAYWFSTVAGTIGIVVGEDDITGKRKGYIGWATGIDEGMDTKSIAEHGSPVDGGVLREIADYLKPVKSEVPPREIDPEL